MSKNWIMSEKNVDFLIEQEKIRIREWRKSYTGRDLTFRECGELLRTLDIIMESRLRYDWLDIHFSEFRTICKVKGKPISKRRYLSLLRVATEDGNNRLTIFFPDRHIERSIVHDIGVSLDDQKSFDITLYVDISLPYVREYFD